MNRIGIYFLLFLFFVTACQSDRVEEYYSTGELLEEYFLVDGKIEGEVKEYYKSGKLRAEGNFVNGKQLGKSTCYYENGSIENIMYYSNGLRNGNFIGYHKNGKLSMKAIVQNDTTVYYEEYDSLGNFVKEYRELSLKIENDTIALPDKFRAVLKLYGPVKNGRIEYVLGQVDSIGVFFGHGQVLKNGDSVFKFVPDTVGIYNFGVHGLYIDSIGKVHSYIEEFSFVVREDRQ